MNTGFDKDYTTKRESRDIKNPLKEENLLVITKWIR